PMRNAVAPARWHFVATRTGWRPRMSTRVREGGTDAACVYPSGIRPDPGLTLGRPLVGRGWPSAPSARSPAEDNRWLKRLGDIRGSTHQGRRRVQPARGHIEIQAPV